MQSELGVDKFLFSKCDISNEDDINHTVEMMKMAGFLPEIVILNAAIFPAIQTLSINSII